MREQTKVIQIGDRKIGGGNPVAIQSMTNTKTEDVAATVAQIHALEEAGCDIIRCAVPTMQAAESLKEIHKQIHIPLVADIHFDYRLALAAIENGADKIRINPGNIGDEERVRAVVNAAKERGIPIRVGVNSGSLEKDIIAEYGHVTAEGLVKSALQKVAMIENMGYDNLVISIKSSDVLMSIKAHELMELRSRERFTPGTLNQRSVSERFCMRVLEIRYVCLSLVIRSKRYARQNLFCGHLGCVKGA